MGASDAVGSVRCSKRGSFAAALNLNDPQTGVLQRRPMGPIEPAWSIQSGDAKGWIGKIFDRSEGLDPDRSPEQLDSLAINMSCEAN
jgi:hypothetical protein